MSTPLSRPFQEVSVGVLGRQSLSQRFPQEYMIEHGLQVPHMVQWAMNLTALSQYHNLYFVVYGIQTHVYVPRGPHQTLLPEATLVLETPQSEAGLRVGGRMAHGLNGHSVNNLMVGNLGSEEVVLCACDDGDVFAYYTQTVENAIHSLSDSFEPIKPFFHENVGVSCWGLAIHERSRLIAVSSNYHEVQVFAFALSAASETSIKPDTSSTDDNLPLVRFPVYEVTSYQLMTDEYKLKRERNYRLILKLTDVGDNIPAIAFSSDIYGRAETVIASDIRGGLWFLGLWTAAWMRLPTVPQTDYSRLEPLGWAVAVLPHEFFKTTRTPYETYGCRETWAVRPSKIDVSQSLAFVRDIAIWHDFVIEDEFVAQIRRDAMFGDDEADDVDDSYTESEDNDQSREEDDIEDEHDASSPISHPRQGSLSTSSRQQGQTYDSDVSSEHSPFQRPVHPRPSTKSYPHYPRSLFGGFHGRAWPINDRSIAKFVTDDSVIFHANRHDVTLIPSSDMEFYTHCENILRQDVPHDEWFPQALTHYNRLNMIATIPEISLVLIASQVGRVALLTVTRPIYKSASLFGASSFRVDLVLPTATEEVAEMYRPSNGLLGIAVSLMPGNRETNKIEPKRWRLLMHYYDHTILSYVISREEETGNVVLF